VLSKHHAFTKATWSECDELTFNVHPVGMPEVELLTEIGVPTPIGRQSSDRRNRSEEGATSTWIEARRR
jgi:hypothetical protein